MQSQGIIMMMMMMPSAPYPWFQTPMQSEMTLSRLSGEISLPRARFPFSSRLPPFLVPPLLLLNFLVVVLLFLWPLMALEHSQYGTTG